MNRLATSGVGSTASAFVIWARFVSVLYVVNTYVVDVTMCVGPSMLPTFNVSGDIVLIVSRCFSLVNVREVRVWVL